MSHLTNVNRGFPQSYEESTRRNLRITPVPEVLSVPPEVLASFSWASQVPVPVDGPLCGFELRIEPPFMGAVSPIIFPSLLDCPPHRVGHNICAFAQAEGCESFVVGALPFAQLWGLQGWVPIDAIDASMRISDDVAQAARDYLAQVRAE